MLLCVCISGCQAKADQAVVEYDGAAFFARRIAFYERQFPGAVVTNLQQVFVGTEVPYSERWHHAFLRFGKYAGFKKSFFEKYVFVPAHLTNRAVLGEVRFLNAEPFPDQKGKMGRIIVSKTTRIDTGWLVKWYPEEEVQQIFRDADQIIPKAGAPIPPPYEVTPPTRPPLLVRVEEYFGDITKNWGLGTAAGRYLMWATFGMAGIVAAVLVAILWGRRMKRKR